MSWNKNHVNADEITERIPFDTNRLKETNNLSSYPKERIKKISKKFSRVNSEKLEKHFEHIFVTVL